MKLAIRGNEHIYTNGTFIPWCHERQIIYIPLTNLGKSRRRGKHEQKLIFLFQLGRLHIAKKMTMSVGNKDIQTNILRFTFPHPKLQGKVLLPVKETLHNHSPLLAQDTLDPPLPIRIVSTHQPLATAAPWRLHDNVAPL